MNIDLDRLPIGGGEDAWLNGMESLAALLGDSLGSRAELGEYWIDDFPRAASAGGGCCVRGKQPLPGIESDSWEARLGWTANRGQRARASATVFPMLRNSVVLPQGRLADQPQGTETERFVGYVLRQNKFECSGWQCGDGPGEWAGIREPGDGYFSSLKCRLLNSSIAAHDPIEIEIEVPEVPDRLCAPVLQPRLSLVHVNRDSERTNLTPWSCHLPRRIGEDAIGLNGVRRSMPARYIFDLRQIRIRGGWTVGDYYFAVRVQNCHRPTAWSWSSQISKSLRLKVVE